MFLALASVLALVVGPAGLQPATGTGAVVAPATLAAFVPNRGQWPHEARYGARIGATSVFLDEDGWRLALRRDAASVALHMRFVAAGAARLLPGQKLAGVHHYFLGNDPECWQTEVPRYAEVRYRGLYPGVQVRAYDKEGRFEYDVGLDAGADVAQVEIRIEGATDLAIDQDGALLIETALGQVRQTPPATFEINPDGTRRPIECRYELRGSDRFGFVTRRIARDRALIIDPGLEWSTYVGGNGTDVANAVAVDAQGIVTIAGSTASFDFPTTPGAFDTTWNASSDVFVTRFDPSRQAADQLLYSTFLGGAAYDAARGLAVDASGVVTITGQTWSADFPTSIGAYDTTHNGGSDAFVTRIHPSRPFVQQLAFSTFLGGEGTDAGTAVVADATGLVTLAGETDSTAFPATPGAFDPTPNGDHDAFVTRLDPSRVADQQLSYSTFLGGGSADYALTLQVSDPGVVTLGGWTLSADFPATPSAFDPVYNGGGDGFAARLELARPAAEQLVYATFLGGVQLDRITALAVDAAGGITIASTTSSTDHPVTPDAFDATFNGGSDAVVAVLDPARQGLRQLAYATFLGGSGDDRATAVLLSGSGAVTVAGDSQSANFPTTPGAFDRSPNGSYDLFVTRLHPWRQPARQLVYSTLLGGALADSAAALAAEASGAVTAAGQARSTNYPVTAGAWHETYAGGLADAVVTRLDLLPAGTRRHGDSSPGCSGPLPIDVTSMPAAGNPDFALTCAAAPASSAGLVVLAAAGQSVPIQILGARLWLDPGGPFFAGAAVQSNAAGAADFALPIPDNPWLIGQRFHAQFFWVGPTAPAPCPPLGVSASTALEVTIQR